MKQLFHWGWKNNTKILQNIRRQEDAWQRYQGQGHFKAGFVSSNMFLGSRSDVLLFLYVCCLHMTNEKMATTAHHVCLFLVFLYFIGFVLDVFMLDDVYLFFEPGWNQKNMFHECFMTRYSSRTLPRNDDSRPILGNIAKTCFCIRTFKILVQTVEVWKVILDNQFVDKTEVNPSIR